MNDAGPAVDVLADLLLAAVEAGRTEDTYTLLADLVGEEWVRAAHRVVFRRLSAAVEAAATPPPAPATDAGPADDPSDDTLDLLRAIRATTPAGLPTRRRSR